MKEFTMSVYKSKEDLYKAKAEYYERKFEKSLDMLKKLTHTLRNTDSSLSYLELLKFIEEIEGE